MSDRNVFINIGLDQIKLEFLFALFNRIDWLSGKPQVLIIVPDLIIAREIFLWINSFETSQTPEIEVLTADNIKKRSVLNGQILIGTPGLVLSFIKNNPKITKNINTCYLIDGYNIFSLGYLTTIQKIFNELQSKVTVITKQTNIKLEEFFSTFQKIDSNQSNLKEIKPEYTKPRALLRYISILKDKNILVVIKKKQELELLKQYFKRHGYEVSENYDVISDFHNHNLIYLTTRKKMKLLNLNQFDYIFNYNVKKFREKILKNLLTSSIESIKDLKDKTKEKVVNSLETTKNNLKRNNLSNLEEQIKSQKKGLQDYLEYPPLEWPDEMRKSVFEILLPAKNITISDSDTTEN